MSRAALDGIEAWHEIVRSPTEAALDALLAADVVFHSPVVHSPQRGRTLAKLYLMGAFQVLAGERPFRYVREIVGERDAVLPVAGVRDLAAAHPDAQVFIYAADHGFNCDQRASFDAAAAKLARARTLEFLRQHVG